MMQKMETIWRKYWYIFLAFIIIAFIQNIILSPHLMYGFSDVDWGFLSIYKLGEPYSFSFLISKLLEGGTLGGLYTHQIYYIGIQNEIFNLDYERYQAVTNFFKILATLLSFPMFFFISRKISVSLVAVFILSFAYSSIGSMYTVVTSGDYLAIVSMEIFVIVYWYIITKKIFSLGWIIFALVLFSITLVLSTERMYPLLFFIIIVELFLYFREKSRQEKLVYLKRAGLFFGIFTLAFLIKPKIFLEFILRGNNEIEIFTRVGQGNWDLLLTPFITLGSIILPNSYAKYLGVINTIGFGEFVQSISGPFIIATFFTVLLGVTVFKNSFKFIISVVLALACSSVCLFILAAHFTDHLISTEAVMQAFVGMYILCLSGVSFKYWITRQSDLSPAIFVGPFFAFIYIFLTWVGSATVEVFSGAHRYLTIPTMFISLFMGAVLVEIYYGALYKKLYLRPLALVPIVLLTILFYVNTSETYAFFKSQLLNGFAAQDKILMHNALLKSLPKLSSAKPSLVYFDFSEESNMGYYYDNALTSGFESWMLWHPSINFNKELAPKTFWNNLELLKKSVQERNGEKVIVYNDIVYLIGNFYAFKLKDRELQDIRDIVLKEIGVNESL